MLPSGRSVSGRGFVTGHRWSCGDGSRLLAPLATKIATSICIRSASLMRHQICPILAVVNLTAEEYCSGLRDGF